VVSSSRISGAISFLRITLETGFVEVTEDHLILVNEKWIPCKYLTAGMEVETLKIIKI